MDNNQEIQQLLEENLKINQEILFLCKEIEHHNKLARIYGFVKTIIIVIPLIAGLLYLIPFFGQIFKGLDMYSQTMTELLK
ncbi:MAG TPA: hypothetical protein PKL13_02900 [bacterium]|nr:hypothetical protein [bacterium]